MAAAVSVVTECPAWLSSSKVFCRSSTDTVSRAPSSPIGMTDAMSTISNNPAAAARGCRSRTGWISAMLLKLVTPPGLRNVD